MKILTFNAHPPLFFPVLYENYNLPHFCEGYKSPSLENYKRAKHFHHKSEEADRLECEPFIQRLESRLNQHDFFMGPTPSLLDYTLLSFVRQFSKVNRQLFREGPYTNLQRWLDYHLQSRLCAKAVFKYPLWLDSGEAFVFGEWANK